MEVKQNFFVAGKNPCGDFFMLLFLVIKNLENFSPLDIIKKNFSGGNRSS